MKTGSIHFSALVLAVSLATQAPAQLPMPIEGPPAFVDYQGRVLDALGDPVALGTTENIEMYFRIWGDISSAQIGELLWAEKQVVTVADGNFSVRLGEGDQIQSSAGDNVVSPGNDDPRPSLLTVFNGSERFLGVSVAANPTVKPASEIQPRLAFLSTPFAVVAEKARFAEFGPSNGTFMADLVGIGTSTPGSLLEVVGLNQLSPSSGTGLISAGAINGNHIAFDADDIQSYSNASTPSTLKLNDHGGNVEIGSIDGQTLVEGLFSVFGGGQGGQFRVFDNAPAGGTQLIAGLDAAFGVNGSQLRFEGDAAAVEIGQNSVGSFVVESSNGTQRFVVQQNGNVGVGTTTPADALTIGGSGNLRLSSGDIKLAAMAGTTIITNYDPAVQWINVTNGDVRSQIYRWGSFNRLHVSSTLNALSPGVILNSSTNSWAAYSDERLKSDVEPVTGILDKIEDIRVVSFNSASVSADESTGRPLVKHNLPARKTKDGTIIKHEIGTIAQDWAEHFPELVNEPQSEDDYYTIGYDRVGVVALGAAQELHAKLKAQEAQLQARDEKIADLEARLARLEGMMKAAK